MQLRKPAFMFLLMAIIVLPFLIYKLSWIISSLPATGTMCFMGKTLNGQFSSEYPVIKFTTTGKDTIFFNGNDRQEFKPGETVPILYKKSNPSGALVSNFTGLWRDAVIYAAVPLLFLLIIFLRADIMPKNSVITIGRKPFIRVDQMNGSHPHST